MPRAATVHAVLVNLLGGTLVGVTIGYVPVCMQFVDYLTDCDRYVDEASCSSLGSGSHCSWRLDPATAVAGCTYKHWEANCTAPAFASQEACTARDHCYYNYKDKECDFTHMWTSLEEGIFAGMMIVGAMTGSVLATPLLRHLGRKKALFVLGLIGTVAAVLVTVGWALEMNYPLLLVGRLLAGIGVGLSSVSSPMYVGEVAPEEHQGVIGCMFQISVTLGICLAAAAGLILDPRNDTSGTHHIHATFHALNALVLAVPVLLLITSLVVTESPLWLATQPGASPGPEDDDVGFQPRPEEEAEAEGESAKVGLFDRLWRIKASLFAGVVLSCALQLTGINAIMTYAPAITASFSLPPLLGNFVVMAWNFVTTLVSIPLARRFTPRHMYFVGTAFATVACIFTAVPTYPGVLANKDASHILGGLGVVFFIAAFEIGMGPAYYILAQDIFPAEDRSFGCSLTVWAQFVCNLIINFGYPVAQTGMSGGPSGNQDKGQSLCFAIFGGCGVLCALYFFFLMPKGSNDARGDEETPFLNDDPYDDAKY